MVQRRRSSSEDRVRLGRGSSSASSSGGGAGAPHIGHVRVTRIEHHHGGQHHGGGGGGGGGSVYRSRSPAIYQPAAVGAGSVTDLSHLSVDLPRRRSLSTGRARDASPRRVR